MAVKTIEVSIEGKSPLLMHAFPMEPIEAIEKKSPQEQAEYAAYRDAETRNLYIPGIALQRALVNGATYVKGKGRGSLQKQAAACLQVNPQRISLGTKDFEVDARPVVVPATRGRIIRFRPRLDTWRVSFELEYDDTLMKATEVRNVVDNTGQRVGLLDFRPEKKGPFGRFTVIKWEANGKAD